MSNIEESASELGQAGKNIMTNQTIENDAGQINFTATAQPDSSNNTEHFNDPNGHGKVTTPDDETLHARSFTPVPPLPKGEGYSSSLREFHVRVERTVQPTPQPVVREVAETAPQVLPLAPPPVAAPAAASAPVVDTEPDYKASYLNNPRPPYPMVARRMSWEGKVILNVEVLAEGACGAVNVFRSSGHEVLDNAAMTTVKTWRFIPAKRAGRAFTQRFKVPINFSLEDEAA